MSDDMSLAQQIMEIPSSDDGEPAPEGSVPVAGVYVLNYIGPDGELYRKWHTEGEPSTDEIFGMFEMTKMRMCAGIYGWDAPDA